MRLQYVMMAAITWFGFTLLERGAQGADAAKPAPAAKAATSPSDTPAPPKPVAKPAAPEKKAAAAEKKEAKPAKPAPAETKAAAPTSAGVAAPPAKPSQPTRIPPVEPVAPMAQGPKPVFRPITAADLQAIKQQLVAAVARLSERFEEAGESSDPWKKLLGWDALQAQVARPGLPELAELEKAFARFSDDDETLGLMWFVDVREVMRTYIAAARAMSDNQTKARFEAISEALQRRLDTYAKTPKNEDAVWIGNAVRWLEDIGQSTPALRQRVSALQQSNLHVQISADLIGAVIGGPVDEIAPVQDYILGTDIYGEGHTQGNLTVKLNPSAERASLETIFTGQVDTNTIGYHKPVQIYSVGTTTLEGHKPLWISVDGLGGEPAWASANVNSTITGIGSKRNSALIAKFACKKANQQKPQAEAIASCHAEQRFIERMEQQAGDMLEKANDGFQTKFRKPLTERKVFPASLAFSTTEERMSIVGLAANAFQLAAAKAPPAAAPGADLTLRLHESMINNMAATALGGRTLHEDTLVTGLTDLLGKMPEQLKRDDDGEAWAITFADEQPISVHFADNRFEFTLRGARYVRGDKSHPGMYVTVAYKLVKDGNTFKAVRDGGLQILPPGVAPGTEYKLSGKQVAIRKLLDRRFSKLFPEEMVGKGIELPGEWKKAGKLQAVALNSTDGWLSVGWKR